jgi:hypothetical protein
MDAAGVPGKYSHNLFREDVITDLRDYRRNIPICLFYRRHGWCSSRPISLHRHDLTSVYSPLAELCEMQSAEAIQDLLPSYLPPCVHKRNMAHLLTRYRCLRVIQNHSSTPSSSNLIPFTSQLMKAESRPKPIPETRALYQRSYVCNDSAKFLLLINVAFRSVVVS